MHVTSLKISSPRCFYSCYIQISYSFTVIYLLITQKKRIIRYSLSTTKIINIGFYRTSLVFFQIGALSVNPLSKTTVESYHQLLGVLKNFKVSYRQLQWRGLTSLSSTPQFSSVTAPFNSCSCLILKPWFLPLFVIN